MFWLLGLFLLLALYVFLRKKSKQPLFVTFVIPTLQRSVLRNALLSLQRQTDQDFFIVLINDSNQPFDYTVIPAPLKTRVKVLDHVSKGWPSPPRNHGLRYIQEHVSTKWVAFLDDDDVLHENYVTWLKEGDKVQSDVLVFRAAGSFDHLSTTAYIPQKQVNRLVMGMFTIAFAVRKESIIYFREDNIQIKKGQTGKLLIAEDFFYLRDCLQKNKKVVISPYIAYGVRRMIDKSIDQHEASYTELFL